MRNTAITASNIIFTSLSHTAPSDKRLDQFNTDTVHEQELQRLCEQMEQHDANPLDGISALAAMPGYPDEWRNISPRLYAKAQVGLSIWMMRTAMAANHEDDRLAWLWRADATLAEVMDILHKRTDDEFCRQPLGKAIVQANRAAARTHLRDYQTASDFAIHAIDFFASCDLAWITYLCAQVAIGRQHGDIEKRFFDVLDLAKQRYPELENSPLFAHHLLNDGQLTPLRRLAQHGHKRLQASLKHCECVAAT